MYIPKKSWQKVENIIILNLSHNKYNTNKTKLKNHIIKLSKLKSEDIPDIMGRMELFDVLPINGTEKEQRMIFPEFFSNIPEWYIQRINE